MKTCTLCNQEKPETEFYIRSNRKQPMTECKGCNTARKKIYHQSKDIEWWRRASYRRAERKTGIPIEEIFKAVKAQDYKCKICNTPEGDKFLAVDHCHRTGQFRGLLCQKCNTGLGQFMDSSELLQKAIAYLQPRPDPLLCLEPEDRF